MENLFSRIPPKYFAYVALALWGALSYLLLNKTSYGIDEGAARALLLVWSVSEDVVSPIVTLGLPDLRALFFAPVGYLWLGNIVAVKVFTLLIMASAVWVMHRWRQHTGNAESALLASGLLLISPLLIEQIDKIAVAPYLLIVFGLGAWLDQFYRQSPRAFGGLYFAQIVLCLVSVTLHPMGLAYPAVLFLAWYKNPAEMKHQKHFIAGITFIVLLALLLTMGWRHVEWFGNPVKNLSGLVVGSSAGSDMGILRWLGGIAVLIVGLLVAWRSKLRSDFLGRILLIASAIGLLTGDETWSVVVLAICLYWGLPLLLPEQVNANSGFWGQRGIALALVVVVSTTFMLVDKARYSLVLSGFMSPRDSLIRSLVEDSGSFSNDEQQQAAPAKKQTVRIASQWPGLTTLACRCDALPLPPAAKDGDTLLAMLRGIKYLMFDPRDPANSKLAQNFATMDAEKVQTVVLQAGGVVIEIKNDGNKKEVDPAQKR